MRQVNEAELITNVRFQLSRIGQQTRNGFAKSDHAARTTAAQIIAEKIVRGALGRLEVLSNAPLPEGSDLFSASAYGTGAGSAPAMES